jgi:hypothetical protein
MDVDRRELLTRAGALAAGAATVGSAGCMGANPPPDCASRANPDGFLIRNVDGAAHEVRVEVYLDTMLFRSKSFDRSYDLEAFPSDERENEAVTENAADSRGLHVIKTTVDGYDTADRLWEVKPNDCNPVLIRVGALESGRPTVQIRDLS